MIQAEGARPPFVCVPGIGGNIVGFYDLARELGPDQPVYGLQAPGLDGKREPLARVEDMAAHYISEIRSVLPDGPFLLGGASFGGIVAFEMARQLEAAGQPVALLALFDATAPGRASMPPLSIARRHFESLGSRLMYHASTLLREPARYVHSKSRTLRRRIRSRIWRILYRSYRSRSRPLPRVLQSVEEAGYIAYGEYAPRPFGGSVTVFRAAVRSAGDTSSPDMGWNRLAQGRVEVYETAGDHVTMLMVPQATHLAAQLRAAIDQAVARERESPLREAAARIPASVPA